MVVLEKIKIVFIKSLNAISFYFGVRIVCLNNIIVDGMYGM